MSTARDYAIADLQKQIAEVELLKATQGQYPATPVGQLQQQQDIYEAQQGIIKAEEQYEVAEQNYLWGIAEKAKRGVNAGTQRVKSGAYGLNRNLANIPAPGGVWVPFWILVFLFFALFPVNGHRRITWIWLVLTGNAFIPLPGIGDLPFPTTPGPTGSIGPTGPTGVIANPGPTIPTPTPAPVTPLPYLPGGGNGTNYFSYVEDYTILGGAAY